MKKKELKKRLAKTEKKLAKLTNELEYTKDKLNEVIAGTEEEQEILTEKEPDPTLVRRLERFWRPIGEDADNIEAQLKGTATIERADSMESAVRVAFESATPGDSVLLAPACASFDMFRSFEERGEVFKAAVNALSEPSAAAGGSSSAI